MRFKRKLFYGITIPPVLFCLLVSAPVYAQELTRALVRDPHYQQGFYLLQPEQGKRVVYGEALVDGAATKPVWDIGQWSSKYPLEAAGAKRLANGTFCLTNIAKRVCVGKPGSADADLLLAVNASVEYDGHARKSQDVPWVHLLAQQDFTNPPSLGELAQCRFHIEARLRQSKLYRTDDYTPDLHAAQFSIYFTVANRNPKASGYGQYYWFGIPVYDDRSRVVPKFEAKDFGYTKMFIYTPASDTYAKESTHDGQWVVFAADLLPLMRDGLRAGWKEGFMPGSREFADYHVMGIFMGWEVPGVFDVEMQTRNLSVMAINGKN